MGWTAFCSQTFIYITFSSHISYFFFGSYLSSSMTSHFRNLVLNHDICDLPLCSVPKIIYMHTFFTLSAYLFPHLNVIWLALRRVVRRKFWEAQWDQIENVLIQSGLLRKSNFDRLETVSLCASCPSCQAPPPTVTAGSLKLQGRPVFSSHYGKLAWSYIWTSLSEKTNKQEVELPTLSFRQLLLMLLGITTEVPFYRARSWGVIRIKNFTYCLRKGSLCSLIQSLGMCLGTNFILFLIWKTHQQLTNSLR